MLWIISFVQVTLDLPNALTKNACARGNERQREAKRDSERSREREREREREIEIKLCERF